MSEIRRDSITGKWILIAPTQGKSAQDFRIERPYEKTPPDCPLCPGNEGLTGPEIASLRHKGSHLDDSKWQVRVVANRFPALQIEHSLQKRGKGMYDTISGFGAHEIIIDNPDHQKTLKEMSDEDVSQLLLVLQTRLEDLYRDKRIRYVSIFKNEGPQAGARLSHPHHQILATPVIPWYLKEHLKGARSYFQMKERCVYCDILHEEQTVGDRIVYENEAFTLFCPYASRYPFECWIVPKAHESNFYSAKNHNIALAQALRTAADRLDQALGCPQFQIVFFSAPNPIARNNYWLSLTDDFHWHIEIIPCVLPSTPADRAVGFPINPTPPEEAAKFLRELEISVS